MLEKAVEKILERTEKYRSHLIGKDAREKRLAQQTVTAEDIPLIIEAYNNKPTSIREFIVAEGGGEDFNDGWWVKQGSKLPVSLKDNRLYFGDVWVDTERLYITSSVGTDSSGTEKKFVCYLMLQGYQVFGSIDGEPTKENSKLFCFIRQICDVKELHEFNGYQYERPNFANYYVANEGLVFTGQSSNKEYMTPLIAKPNKPENSTERKGNNYDHVMLRDVSGKSHPVNVHKLVATLWVKNDDPVRKTHVNHRDLNPRNNAAENLEWCTPAYNMQYTYTFRALQEALPGIDCHLWLNDCRNLTENVLGLKSEDKTKLTCAAAVQISKRLEHENLAAAS